MFFYVCVCRRVLRLRVINSKRRGKGVAYENGGWPEYDNTERSDKFSLLSRVGVKRRRPLRTLSERLAGNPVCYVSTMTFYRIAVAP